MTTEKTGTIPQDFANLFRRVVRRCQIPGGKLEPGTIDAYWEALAAYPVPVLAQAAVDLARRLPFLPTTAEWAAAVRDLTETPAPVTCEKCGNRGLVRVEYHQGGPYDVAICDCPAGQWYDTVGEAGIRAIVGLTAAHRVAWIEAFEDEV